MDEDLWSAELRKRLAAMGVIPDEQKLLGEEMAMGQEMAQTPTPQGYHVGRYYIAANPLEHVAAGIQRFQGMRQAKQARQGMRDSFAKQTAGRESMMGTILDRVLGEQRAAGPYTGSVPGMIE